MMSKGIVARCFGLLLMCMVVQSFHIDDDLRLPRTGWIQVGQCLLDCSLPKETVSANFSPPNPFLFDNHSTHPVRNSVEGKLLVGMRILDCTLPKETVSANFSLLNPFLCNR